MDRLTAPPPGITTGTSCAVDHCVSASLFPCFPWVGIAAGPCHLEPSEVVYLWLKIFSKPDRRHSGAGANERAVGCLGRKNLRALKALPAGQSPPFGARDDNPCQWPCLSR